MSGHPASSVAQVVVARAPPPGACLGIRFRSYQPIKGPVLAETAPPLTLRTESALGNLNRHQTLKHSPQELRRLKSQHDAVWQSLLSWRATELRKIRRGRVASQVTRSQLERLLKTLRKLGWKTGPEQTEKIQNMLSFNRVTKHVTEDSIVKVVEYLKGEVSRLRNEHYAKSVSCAKRRSLTRARRRRQALLFERGSRLAKGRLNQAFSCFSSNQKKRHSLVTSLLRLRKILRKRHPDEQGLSINDGWPPRHAVLVGTLEPFKRKVYVFNRRLDNGARQPTVVICIGDRPLIYFTKNEIVAVKSNFRTILQQLFKSRKSLSEGIKRPSEIGEMLEKARGGARVFLD